MLWNTRVIDSNNGLFECFNANDNHDPFFVVVDMDYHKHDITVFERSVEIAEHELDMWNGGFEELEDKDEYDRYYYSGYGQVVEEALDKEGIIYDIFYKEEREVV